jgi:8-oxo-dGTP diphosphatase
MPRQYSSARGLPDARGLRRESVAPRGKTAWRSRSTTLPTLDPLADLAWRTAFRLGFPLARLWWRVRRTPHQGALVAVWVGPQVLLLRSSYRRAWTFPGGGIRPGEAPEAAARRELAEETGLVVAALRPARIIDGVFDGRPDRVHFFELHLERAPLLRLDNREVIAARFVGPAERDGMALTGSVADYFRQARPS